ncbi:hypothetical protein EV383_4403 [Pseudonocardia sediminis]|uniref:Uncharacterized protein n=1 Tax=Pseudonocardia sediminis TaxID=1397368 RepID=A0A4Q7V1Z7_PSEST|nr:hypothetical protein [Pseudonocardia sediminis]RZT87478.1 hypothetical protein EV383_4403 [Pseudonocardia sediminis]
MANDWLRAVHERLDGCEPRERVPATVKPGECVVRRSSLYPQFLDAGIPPVEDHEED